MKIERYFSNKDYFNYYIAGLVWCVNIFLLLVPTEKMAFGETLIDLTIFFDAANFVLISAITAVVPYLLGFILTPISDKIGELIREQYPDPVAWVVEDPEKNSAGLKKGEIKLLNQYVKEHFVNQSPLIKEWFFQIRAIVAQDNGGASLLANRALEMTNLAESLLLPVPLCIFIIGIRFLLLKNCIYSIFTILISIVIFCFLIKRYIDLRSYWVKHIYRAYIAIYQKQKKINKKS